MAQLNNGTSAPQNSHFPIPTLKFGKETNPANGQLECERKSSDPTEKLRDCNRCDQRATEFCESCSVPYCNSCKTETHLKGRWAAHKFNTLQSQIAPQPPPRRTKPPFTKNGTFAHSAPDISHHGSPPRSTSPESLGTPVSWAGTKSTTPRKNVTLRLGTERTQTKQSTPDALPSPQSTGPSESRESNLKKKDTQYWSKQGRIRQNVIEEIISTEQTYVDDLKMIIEVFIMPLRLRNAISLEDCSTIFGNIETLYNCNNILLNSLLEKKLLLPTNKSEDEALSIGNVFSKIVPFLKMYNIYTANRPKSEAKLEELKKNVKFQEVLKVCHGDPRCKGLPLNSFLTKPIQRICKYPLLFRELVAQFDTDKNTQEKTKLEQVLSKIDECAKYINERTKDREQKDRIVEIQSLFLNTEKLGVTILLLCSLLFLDTYIYIVFQIGSHPTKSKSCARSNSHCQAQWKPRKKPDFLIQ